MKLNELSVAKIMIKELIRDKVFASIFAGAALLVLSTVILNEMVVGEKIKATKDLGLSLLNLFALFIVIFLGITQISRDLSQKSLYFLFAKPVRKSSYLFGGFFSIVISLIAGIILLSVLISILSVLQGEWWLSGLLQAAFLTLLESLIITAFALFFAVITSPQLAMFLTLLVYVLGHSLEKAAVIVDSSSNLFLKYTIQFLYPILPNLEFFNKKAEIVYRIDIGIAYHFHAALYAIVYSMAVLLVTVFLFKRKEL